MSGSNDSNQQPQAAQAAIGPKGSAPTNVISLQPPGVQFEYFWDLLKTPSAEQLVLQETGGTGWKQILKPTDFEDEDEIGWLSYYFTQTDGAPQSANFDLLIQWDKDGTTMQMKVFEDIPLQDLINNCFDEIHAEDAQFS